MPKKTNKKKCRLKRRVPITGPDAPIRLHLVVTRETGDTERYPLGTVRDLRLAYAYRRKLAKVSMPMQRKVA